MKSSRDSSDDVSLFPFLAVLLCTMGSLVVLLFVVAHRARLQAAIPAAKTEPAAAVSPQRLAALRDSQSRLDRRLDRGRQVLQHVEQRIRSLRETMERLKRAAHDLGQLGQSSAEQQARDRAELVRLRKLAAEAEQELERLQREAAGRPPSYAIVPYQGGRKTHRRPLYIECLTDRVVLQPEGIELTRADFENPLGPGNPLASALRAASQYYVNQQLRAARAGQQQARPEPYPLLLVRPDGVVAYYQVLEAIGVWEGQYGYELVESDWQLEFPTADPQLAHVEQQAVDEARARRVRLALAAPSQYGRRGGHAGGGTAGGGFEPFENPSPDTEEPRGPFGTGSFAAKRQATEAHTEAPRGQFGTGSFAAKRQATEARPAGSEPKATAAAGRRPSGAVRTAGSAERTAAGGQEPAGSSAAAAGSESAATGDGGSPMANAAGSGQPPESLAAKRGRNWALPNSGRNGVPIRRPLRVLVREDRIAILPDTTPDGAGAAAGRVVLLDGSTKDAMDQFVAVLWDQIESWGIAGKGMYWKPVLSLHVAPGGRPRARQIQALLRDSGLEIVETSKHSQRGGMRR